MNTENSLPNAFHTLLARTVLTVKEASHYLEISSDTVYTMCHLLNGENGELPHFHVGAGSRGIRFYRPLLDLWAIGNSHGGREQELLALKKAYLQNIGKGLVMETAVGEPHV